DRTDSKAAAGEPAPAMAPPVAPPAPAPPATVAPTPEPSKPAPPPAPDPTVELAKQMKALLDGFAAWSATHAGAPCPPASALGAPVDDPWGHPIAITCTDQPATHVIGAISAGPDGAMGSADDIGSWQLGGEVTQLVRGQRWGTDRPAAKPSRPRPSRPAATQPPKHDDDDIPRERCSCSLVRCLPQRSPWPRLRMRSPSPPACRRRACSTRAAR
ncbi:MAG: hypothetical protein ACRDMZ_05945, partial [Solirubrobacteraceae bacterium]